MIALYCAKTREHTPIEGSVFKVGRASDCNLVIRSDRVSRIHFTLVRFSDEEPGYTLFDGDFESERQSRNGVRVNWFWVVGSHLLKHGDKIRFAGHSLEYRQLDGKRPKHLTVY